MDMEKRNKIIRMVEQFNMVNITDLNWDNFYCILSPDLIEEEGIEPVPMYGYVFDIRREVDDYDDFYLKTGLIAYENEGSGSVFFGINGVGYDFYSTHWEKVFDYFNEKLQEKIDSLLNK